MIENIALFLNCCSDGKKCEKCPPDFARRYFVEIDDEKDEESRYTVFFPLLGFDEVMRNEIQFFNPKVTCNGFWYLSHRDAQKIYKYTDKEEDINRTLECIMKHISDKKDDANTSVIIGQDNS
jgi:hypothetical protein